MNKEILNQIATKMVSDSKGILAIDESHGTCKKRFDTLKIAVNEENRRSYRDMLVSAGSLAKYIAIVKAGYSNAKSLWAKFIY